jgi:competence ComEA-like helix-hairpin-helix protein
LERGELLTYRLDLNQASHGELMQLPGIGPKLAQRILEYRQRHGKFHTVTDLKEVPGIGPTVFKRIEGWVCINGSEEGAKAADSARHQAAKEPKSQEPPFKPATVTRKAGKEEGTGPTLDVNTATREQLQKLPRIGPVLSQRIIEERNLRPFTSVDDLKRVKGIGPKTLAGIRPYVTVGK